MVAPASLKNDQSQSIPTLISSAGTGRLSLGVGAKAVGYDASAAWAGVATHADADTFNASDGIVVIGGTYSGAAKSIAVDSLGRLAVLFAPATGALTNASGTIAAGGTSQAALALNASRVYLFVQNLDDAEDMWIDFGATAVIDQPSIRLGPGQSFVMEGNFVTSAALNVIAATTGHKFTCKEA